MSNEWAPSAHADLLEALKYFIEQEDRETGQQLVTRLFRVTDRLATFPLSGKAGRIPGTRELMVPGLPYVLLYHMPQKNAVEIIRVVHTSRLWPPVPALE